MFGYVVASERELSKEALARYTQVYCGICRRMGGAAARLTLSYDMAFLALLLMSLYEPEERGGKSPCLLHPLARRPFADCEAVAYAADMNTALSYYKALDDAADDGKLGAKLLASRLEGEQKAMEEKYPRQLKAIRDCLDRLGALEKENCPNPDLPANCFGALMGELLTWKEDRWAPALRDMGMALGRFIYLADAAVDYRRDRKKGSYNPFIAMGGGENPEAWEEYLVLAMGRCTRAFERLPLVQDKALLDNILYSGVWTEYRRRLGGKRAGEVNDDGRSL